MKNKLQSVNNIPFLVCLAVLLLNDFYLKAEYHNWITGKLSDICGLFVFASFWAAIFPDKKHKVYISTALLFVLWKSPYSQGFIDFFSQAFYPIHRLVDVTDLFALFILPIAFYYNPENSARLKLNPVVLGLLTIFSFCATSVPEPTQQFEQPQYLLFKSGITTFQSREYPSEYQVYELDSLIIVDIKEIRIDKRAPINDEFHKVQILKDIELRLLRDLKNPYGSQDEISDYDQLLDSLIVAESTSITLQLDSITDHLNFKKSRLHGDFKRFSSDNSLLIEGTFNNGVEDSVWSFYNEQNAIALKKYFENGELTKTQRFEGAEIISENHFITREETVRNKYFHLAIIALLIIGLVVKLYLNFKRSEQKDIIKVSHFAKTAGALVLPLVILILAKFLSSLIPNSYSTFDFQIIGEAILVYFIATPLFFLIFYLVKLRSQFYLIYYILLLSLSIVFIEECFYLQSII